MQGVVNTLRKLFADTRDTGQIFHARARHFAQTSEPFEQFLPAHPTHAGYVFQDRRGARPCAALPMAGNGEAMGFVANLLDKVQSGRVRGQYNGRLVARQEQLLLTGFAIRPLVDPDHGHALHLQLLQNGLRRGDLSLAAVDEQHVGEPPLPLLEPGVAA